MEDKRGHILDVSSAEEGCEVILNLDGKALDEVIEKANRLVELLREATQIIDSLSGEKKCIATSGVEAQEQQAVAMQNKKILCSGILEARKEAWEEIYRREGSPPCSI